MSLTPNSDAVLKALGVGWYEQATGDPEFDPGNVTCLVCGKPWTLDTVRTISLMGIGSGRSYFYRVHRACDQPAQIQSVEDRIIDGDSAALVRDA